MNKFQIAAMALDRVAKPGAKAVVKALDNVVESAPAVSKAAVERMAKVSDDWGWKGGKPGEVTGELLDNLEHNVRNATAEYTRTGKNFSQLQESIDLQRAAERQAFKQMERLKKKDPQHPVVQQYDYLRAIYKGSPKRAASHAITSGFGPFERANIPRKWTGKLTKAIGPIEKIDFSRLLNKNDGSYIGYSPSALAQELSKSMRTMSNAQQEVFVTMLPGWKGTLEELTQAARMLS